MKAVASVAKYTLFLVLVWSAPAIRCAELHVMTSGTFAATYRELKPVYERATGHVLVTESTSMGSVILKRLERGERADIVIMDANALALGVKTSLVIPDSVVALVRTTIGMAVRAGATVPDISTVAALKRTLLAAKTIGYSASVSGNYLSGELFPRLGIAEELRPKCRRIEGEHVGYAVARGEVEIGFQQLSELLPIAGITIVGSLPAEVQLVSVFSAAVPMKAEFPDEARAFIKFLASDASSEVIRRTGLEPIHGNSKPPNKAPEPTPRSVTPRATESKSK